MYDENKAASFINQRLNDKFGVEYDPDEILAVVDAIWDFYHDHNLLDIDSDAELDIDKLIASIKRLVAKDKQSPINLDHIPELVQAELDYEDSIELPDEI